MDVYITPCFRSKTKVTSQKPRSFSGSTVLSLPDLLMAGSVAALRMAQLQTPQDMGCMGRTMKILLLWMQMVNLSLAGALLLSALPQTRPSASCDTLGL